MELTRKRRKELTRLRNEADRLWDDQKEVLEHASKVVREASRQAARIARDDLSSRMRDTYEDRMRPAFKSGAKRARSVAHNTREHFVGDVLPPMTSALSSALAALEIAKSQKIRDAVNRATRAGTSIGTKVGLVEKKPGPGRYILAGVALVAVLGVAYAAWQTLREDEGLWIDDEPDFAAGDV
ncbi:MAG: hypothetical protein EPN91_11510 [Salinibacterium sp.]|nr:MAG: hypothetical protein EPN91_11510 [Salinibacterium sp.]